jgi:hypothetical protein
MERGSREAREETVKALKNHHLHQEHRTTRAGPTKTQRMPMGLVQCLLLCTLALQASWRMIVDTI